EWALFPPLGARSGPQPPAGALWPAEVRPPPEDKYLPSCRACRPRALAAAWPRSCCRAPARPRRRPGPAPSGGEGRNPPAPAGAPPTRGRTPRAAGPPGGAQAREAGGREGEEEDAGLAQGVIRRAGAEGAAFGSALTAVARGLLLPAEAARQHSIGGAAREGSQACLSCTFCCWSSCCSSSIGKLRSTGLGAP
ncbi:unnamed protein product, partial [Prorocentrum cordatum]